MNTSTIATTCELQSQLHRSILLVGSLDDLKQALPSMEASLSACEQLHACGELPNEDPASELWRRIQSFVLNECGLSAVMALSTLSASAHFELIGNCPAG